ncbi:6386_t:CDS:2 [Entrophospora sp. SA101]|nr:6386_t:CDS:2 [Entrophospora sp. SA101]
MSEQLNPPVCAAVSLLDDQGIEIHARTLFRCILDSPFPSNIPGPETMTTLSNLSLRFSQSLFYPRPRRIEIFSKDEGVIIV